MRYTQLAKFAEIGEKGQKELTKKTITIVGLGNLGSTLAVMFSRAGINLRLVDKGRCSTDDLSTQLIYLEEDDTRFKAKQAKKRLEQVNTKVKIRTFHEDLTKSNVYLLDSDLIIDTSGNPDTSKTICEYAKKQKIPGIYAVNSGSKGLVISCNKSTKFDKILAQVKKLKPIKDVGLINPTVFMAAAIVTKKAFKLLLKKPYHKEIVTFDVWNDTMRRTKL